MDLVERWLIRLQMSYTFDSWGFQDTGLGGGQKYGNGDSYYGTTTYLFYSDFRVSIQLTRAEL